MARDLPVAVELSPDERASVERDTARCIELLGASRFAEARPLAESVMRRDPHAARARAVRAMCLVTIARLENPPELRLWREAEGELRRAEIMRPDDLVVGRYHARFLIADGHLTAAAARLDKILIKHPRDPRALALLGRVRYDLGDEHKAADAFFDYISLEPDDAEAHYILGQCRLRMAGAREDAAGRREDFERAREYFVRYSELLPGDPSGPLGVARAVFGLLAPLPVGEAKAQQLAAEAMRQYDSAESLDPRLPEPAFGRGVLLDYLGEKEAARTAYESALERHAEYVPALLNLAANCEAAGLHSRALDYARVALALKLTRSERDALQNFVAVPATVPEQPVQNSGKRGR